MSQELLFIYKLIPNELIFSFSNTDLCLTQLVVNSVEVLSELVPREGAAVETYPFPHLHQVRRRVEPRAVAVRT